ncbi:MAG: sterol desaturase family protein [Hyphomicrobium sp.]
MDIPVSISEPVVRFATFAIVLFILASLEAVIPKRALNYSKWRRWTTNFSVVATGIATVRGLALLANATAVPLVALAAAELAGANGWGLFNSVDWPDWFELCFAIVVLDFAVWLQHVLSHKIPVLWRLHQVHHADVDIDVTTALRFHPIEIGLSMLYKVVWVLALGPAALAVLVFEIVLNACAMFSHSNINLPARLDRLLRTIIVTPDMHRVHHSVLRHEHDSNYGFNLSVWDRLFGTYTGEPRDGHIGMTIGLAAFQSEAPARLLWSLWRPFASADVQDRLKETD